LHLQDPQACEQTSRRLPFRGVSATALCSRTGLWGVRGGTSGSRVLQRRLRQMEWVWQVLAIKQVWACMHATRTQRLLHHLSPKMELEAYQPRAGGLEWLKEPAMITRQKKKRKWAWPTLSNQQKHAFAPFAKVGQVGYCPSRFGELPFVAFLITSVITLCHNCDTLCHFRPPFLNSVSIGIGQSL